MRVFGGIFCREVISNSCVLGPSLCSVVSIPSSVGCCMSGLTREGLPAQKFSPQPAATGRAPAVPISLLSPVLGMIRS